MRKNCHKLTAFTLAEVLITLTIIGVVAALTIPVLMENSAKQQYVVGLKKAYTTWNQAILLMAVDSGCPGNLSCFFDSADLNTMGDKISAYFKPIKICKSGVSDDSCFTPTEATHFDGTSVSSVVVSSHYRFVTPDGMTFGLLNSYAGCGTTAPRICMGDLEIDVNGLKKPNAMGRDIFLFTIVNDNGPTLYPVGGPNNGYWKTNNFCNVGYNGGTSTYAPFCTGRIMEEGWQMNY